MKTKIKSEAMYRWLKSVQTSFAIVATVMVCLTNTGCKKEDVGEKSGTIKYKNDVYTVSIGEIGKNSNGDIWIELTGNLKPEINIIQGKITPLLGMRIFVDGRSLEYDSMSIDEGIYVYGFKTGKNPEKIIVYSNDGSNASLTFDGKTKRVKL